MRQRHSAHGRVPSLPSTSVVIYSSTSQTSSSRLLHRPSPTVSRFLEVGLVEVGLVVESSFLRIAWWRTC